MKEWIVFLSLMLLGWVALACARPLAEPPVVSVEAKARAAEASYGAQLLACVEAHRSPAAIDACADGVRARWSADGGAR